MEQCSRLKEYSQFIDCIRQMQEHCEHIEDAVDLAIELCISHGILTEILSVHRREVVSMFLTEYDQKAHIKMERKEWLEIGREEGWKAGQEKGQKDGIQKAKLISQLSSQGCSVTEIARKLSLSEESVREFLE